MSETIMAETMTAPEAEKTVSVDVASMFTLVRDNGTREVFMEGPYMMTEADASHWFVKAHLVGAQEADPALGSPDYADRMRRVRAARKAALDEAERLVAEAEAAEAERKAEDPAYSKPAEPVDTVVVTSSDTTVTVVGDAPVTASTDKPIPPLPEPDPPTTNDTHGSRRNMPITKAR